MLVGVLFLLLRVEVVFFLSVFALAGLGGEGSRGRRRMGVGGGCSGLRIVGWKMGGAGVWALWPCAFNASRFRRGAADGSCGLYDMWRRSFPGGWWYGDDGEV